MNAMDKDELKETITNYCYIGYTAIVGELAQKFHKEETLIIKVCNELVKEGTFEIVETNRVFKRIK